MLTLSRSQYKELCTDCAQQMMSGTGHGLPATIPDFVGTDVQFFVADPALSGGGFMDTLSSTWGKVKEFVTESPLAQQVVKKGLAEGKRIARGVADAAVKAGIDKLPDGFQGPVESLAASALDKLGDAAERRAQDAIIAQAPSTAPAIASGKARATGAKSKGARQRKMKGAGGPYGPIELNSGSPVSAAAFNSSILPPGATVVPSTNALMAY
eukprot:COSAG06_NODE_1488_length_9290_cov_4.140899_10_plen_212_part_00